MLVLSRKKNESLRIGDAIEVTILEIHGNRARIGIQAPRNVQIQRSEIWVQIQEQRAAKKE